MAENKFSVCEECSGQGMVIVNISKGIVRPCPICKGNGKVKEGEPE